MGVRVVVCRGDSFDDLMAGRSWGEHRAEYRLGWLSFRHIATTGTRGEVSGHYHPKARMAGQAARRSFLSDRDRVILPAYGTHAGGLASINMALCRLMLPDALAILTGTVARTVPMPRHGAVDGF